MTPRPDPSLPRSGDLLHLTAAASVQFAATRAIYFRVIRAHDWTTSVGYVWLDGYQVDADGKAVERRTVYVQIAGLRPAGQHIPTPRRYRTPSEPQRKAPARGRA